MSARHRVAAISAAQKALEAAPDMPQPHRDAWVGGLTLLQHAHAKILASSPGGSEQTGVSTLSEEERFYRAYAEATGVPAQRVT